MGNEGDVGLSYNEVVEEKASLALSSNLLYICKQFISLSLLVFIIEQFIEMIINVASSLNVGNIFIKIHVRHVMLLAFAVFCPHHKSSNISNSPSFSQVQSAHYPRFNAYQLSPNVCSVYFHEQEDN